MAVNKKQEDDDVPLVQYLLESKRGYFNRISPPMKLNTQKLPLHRRPSCPTTPLSLLDTFSDDEDDEDLVPIGFITTQQRKQGQFQSAAEKYKEKVKAQLNDINILVDDDDDDDLPLSKSCFFI